MFKLLRHFSICSAVVTVLMTAGLVTLYGTAEFGKLVAATEEQNVALSRAFANSLDSAIIGYVDEVQAVDPAILRNSAETQTWKWRLKSTIAGLPVLKVKFYSVGGKTIFSSEEAQIGGGPSSGVQFDLVISSARSHSKLDYRETFVSFDGIVAARRVVGTYVPVFDEERRVRAVLELYTDVTPQVIAATARIWLAGIAIATAFGLTFIRPLHDRETSRPHPGPPVRQADPHEFDARGTDRREDGGGARRRRSGRRCQQKPAARDRRAPARRARADAEGPAAHGAARFAQLADEQRHLPARRFMQCLPGIDRGGDRCNGSYEGEHMAVQARPVGDHLRRSVRCLERCAQGRH